jgi:hypothetical protein
MVQFLSVSGTQYDIETELCKLSGKCKPDSFTTTSHKYPRAGSITLYQIQGALSKVSIC